MFRRSLARPRLGFASAAIAVLTLGGIGGFGGVAGANPSVTTPTTGLTGTGTHLVTTVLPPTTLPTRPTTTVIKPAKNGAGPGYWLVGGDGGVFPFGRGAYEGGMATRSTNAPIVGLAVTKTGIGYWLAASDGGVFAFGDANWWGSLPGGVARRARVTGIAATPNGDGYWLAGSDGGVFALGRARYLGGVAGKALSAPVVAIAATPTGKGYWLFGSDGAVYAFGDAPYVGGVTTSHLQGRIVAAAATATGRGYWLAGSDGGVYALGDAPFVGSLSGHRHASIVGIARATHGDGYWLAGADGGVFRVGESGYFGSVGSSRLNRRIVGIAAGDGIAVPQTPTSPWSTAGFDISWPQCDGIRPAPPYGFGVVGVTGGHLFSSNPCLDEQWGWATGYGSFAAVYVNTNAPTADEFAALRSRRAAACGPDTGCALDLWGRDGARQAIRDAAGLPAPMWWLDVETGNEWLPDKAANAVVLRAMVDELQKAGKRVGIYSTSHQWGVIAGDYSPGLPLWVAGAPSENPASYCDGHSFAGGSAWMAQSGDANFDTDVLCVAGLDSYRAAFAAPAPMVVPQYGAPPSTTAGRASRAMGRLDEAMSVIGQGAHGAEGVAVLAGRHARRWGVAGDVFFVLVTSGLIAGFEWARQRHLAWNKAASDSDPDLWAGRGFPRR